MSSIRVVRSRTAWNPCSSLLGLRAVRSVNMIIIQWFGRLWTSAIIVFNCRQKPGSSNRTSVWIWNHIRTNFFLSALRFQSPSQRRMNHTLLLFIAFSFLFGCCCCAPLDVMDAGESIRLIDLNRNFRLSTKGRAMHFSASESCRLSTCQSCSNCFFFWSRYSLIVIVPLVMDILAKPWPHRK